MNIAPTVQIVDARETSLKASLGESLANRRNFVTILSDSDEVKKLTGLLGYVPQKLERFGVYALCDVLKSEDYTQLLELCTRCEVRFVEQLRIPANKPPATKPIILYCELRGLISEHLTLNEATATLMEYLHRFQQIKLFPLAGIYQFDGTTWKRVRKLTE